MAQTQDLDTSIWRFMEPRKKLKLKHRILEWLGSNYTPSKQICLPRNLVYEHYLSFCQDTSIPVADRGAFGKIIAEKFSQARMRRLGRRGKNQYYYHGMDLNPDSIVIRIAAGRIGSDGPVGDPLPEPPMMPTFETSGESSDSDSGSELADQDQDSSLADSDHLSSFSTPSHSPCPLDLESHREAIRHQEVSDNIISSISSESQHCPHHKGVDSLRQGLCTKCSSPEKCNSTVISPLSKDCCELDNNSETSSHCDSVKELGIDDEFVEKHALQNLSFDMSWLGHPSDTCSQQNSETANFDMSWLNSDNGDAIPLASESSAVNEQTNLLCLDTSSNPQTSVGLTALNNDGSSLVHQTDFPLKSNAEHPTGRLSPLQDPSPKPPTDFLNCTRDSAEADSQLERGEPFCEKGADSAQNVSSPVECSLSSSGGHKPEADNQSGHQDATRLFCDKQVQVDSLDLEQCHPKDFQHSPVRSAENDEVVSPVTNFNSAVFNTSGCHTDISNSATAKSVETRICLENRDSDFNECNDAISTKDKCENVHENEKENWCSAVKKLTANQDGAWRNKDITSVQECDAPLNEMESGSRDAALNEMDSGSRDAALNEMDSSSRDAALNEMDSGSRDAALNERNSDSCDAALNEMNPGSCDVMEVEEEVKQAGDREVPTGEPQREEALGTEPSAFGGGEIMSSLQAQHGDSMDVSTEDLSAAWPKLTPDQKKVHRERIDEWLGEVFEINPQVCLPRTSLYNLYCQHCDRERMSNSSQALFGRMLQNKFKWLKMRRLGTRTNSKYYYMGIDMKNHNTKSPHFQGLLADRLVTPKGRPKCSRVFNGVKKKQ